MNPIQPNQTQVLMYRNSLIRGVCVDSKAAKTATKDNMVQVTWSTGFRMSASAGNWDNREMLEKPENARELQGEEREAALAFFARVEEAQKHFIPTPAQQSTQQLTKRPRP